MYNYYFHVKFKRKYTLEQPSVLIICSVISLHLNTTTTGSGVKRNYTETGTWDEYDVIDIPLRFAISIYNAASGLACTKEEPSPVYRLGSVLVRLGRLTYLFAI